MRLNHQARQAVVVPRRVGRATSLNLKVWLHALWLRHGTPVTQSDPWRPLSKPSAGRLPGRSACLSCDAHSAEHQAHPSAPLSDIVGDIVGVSRFGGFSARPGEAI
jgi:hypothetical protein